MENKGSVIVTIIFAAATLICSFTIGWDSGVTKALAGLATGAAFTVTRKKKDE